MDVIDLLVTIVVVTILITIVLAVVTYVAYKLRLARQPSELDRPVDGLRYFVEYSPPGSAGGPAGTPQMTAEAHATEA